MSGLSGSIPPRALPAPERPPVESCTIIPGQCRSIPAFSSANRSGSDVGEPSSFLTWQWAMVAPASKASWVDSTCSATVIGTAGLSAFCGTEPVMATQMMQGFGHRAISSRMVASLSGSGEERRMAAVDVVNRVGGPVART